MNMYRRNNFRDWLADVGYLYLIVIGFVLVVFLARGVDRSALTIERDVPAVSPEQRAAQALAEE
jgi:hypothetical protein